MGKLELETKKRRRRAHVQLALLAAVAIPGALAVAVMAPNVLQILGTFSGSKRKFNYRLTSVAARLVEKGYAHFVTVDGKKYLEITPAGREELSRTSDHTRKKQRWDKRWRMVMFDIPERRRKVRDSLRHTMERFGFVRLQDSAWIYPYDCEDFIALLKADLHTGSTVLYLIVETIENDAGLREVFDL